MTSGVPVSIPRWQWRTFAPDLSRLGRRLSTSTCVEVRRVEETHLVCQRSAHHAWLHGEVLELRWRKEVGPEGFELWDTVLRTAAPFDAASVARLFSAWGLAAPAAASGLDAAGLLAGPVAAASEVVAVPVVRRQRTGVIDSVSCCFETIRAHRDLRVDSFAVEHEDPSVIEVLLADLGLSPAANTGFPQGLKNALGMPKSQTG